MATELEKQMKKLAALGITVSVTEAPGAAFREPSPSHLIAEEAKRQGIYDERGSR